MSRYNFETNLSAEKAEKIIQVLRTVYDPEIPINVYDLGLIYEVSEKNKTLHVKMTLTAPGCPLANFIAKQVGEVLKDNFPEYEYIDIEVVFDPPWTPLRLSPEGRERFKEIYGYDIVEEYLKRTSQK